MKTIYHVPVGPDETGWRSRHQQAVHAAVAYRREPTAERTIIHAIAGWCDYAELHQRRFESPIGEDYVLGPAWARWGFALRELLNGETGRLDCGTLDTIIHDNLSEQGFDPDKGTP